MDKKVDKFLKVNRTFTQLISMCKEIEFEEEESYSESSGKNKKHPKGTSDGNSIDNDIHFNTEENEQKIVSESQSETETTKFDSDLSM